MRLAFVTLVVTYTSVECPDCRKKVAWIPGRRIVEVRTLARVQDGSGRGRVVSCKRCNHLCEVIEHG